MIENQTSQASSKRYFAAIPTEHRRKVAGEARRTTDRSCCSDTEATGKKAYRSHGTGDPFFHTALLKGRVTATSRLKIAFNTANFVLHRLSGVFGVHYHVSIRGGKRKHYFFRMEIESGKWCIANTSAVPAWVMQLESELSEAIIKHKPFAV